MTPETETTTHYFYGMAHRYLHDEQWITDFWMSAVFHAFEDDRLMIEAVQRNMGSATDIVALRPHINKSDQTALMARRHLASLIRSEEHTSELQSLMRISYAVFCLKKKKSIESTNKLIS